MNAKQRNHRLRGGGVLLMGGLLGLMSLIDSANTTAKAASVVTSLPPTAYYAVKDGQLTDLTATGMMATHPLDRTTPTTWTATAQTDLPTATGQTTRYLYISSARDGVQGWTAATNLRAGRTYQTTAPQAVKPQNYVAVKSFKTAPVPTRKVYRLVGKRRAMHWQARASLQRDKTYRVTQRRTYYQAGKADTYLHVTSGKTSGWVWQADLKRGTAYNVAHHQAAMKAKLQKYLNSVTRDGTAAVAFYNLAPVKGSRAAKAPHAAVYRQGKLAVNARGSHVTTSASTYKLYIAAYLMHLKQRHRFSWTHANRAGMTRMIVKSANDYPVSVLQRHGRTSINRWVAAQGYYGHPFSATRASRTTANSLVKVLKDLQLGQRAFTNRQDRAFILSLMKRQVYRRGIPTGVARANQGTVVRDKVGFLNDNNGDAGIVTLPNGQRYILAVLTWGRGQHGFSGYPRIARIAEHVQKIVY